MTNEFMPGANMGVSSDIASGAMDFSNYDEKAQFEPLPAGVYNAVIENMERKTSKAGNPMLTLTFKVVHEDYKNRKLFNHFVLDPSNTISMGRLKKFLIEVFPDVDLTNVNFDEMIQQGTAIGRECTLKVAQRAYNGNMTNDVKEVMGPSDGGIF